MQPNDQNLAEQQLLAIRERISDIDHSLIKLLASRRKLSIDIANVKQSINRPLRDQLREKQLLDSLVYQASLLDMDSNYVRKIFHIIIEDSVRYQQKLVQSKLAPQINDSTSKKVAVLGGLGAYSHLAAKQFFYSSDNQYDACDSFIEIIKKVENDHVEYGVIPIENTTSGGITEVYDLLLGSNLQIIGEEKLAIKHCLVAHQDAILKDIATIYAHPQAAKQCSEDLAPLTSTKVSLVESTAHALAKVATGTNNSTAAIASEQAAELFGLAVLQNNLANQKMNFTRFIVLAKQGIQVSPAVQCKTTIALSTGQQPGSLAKVLTLFENAKITLTKLESRPIPEKPWEQLFYIDFRGNLIEPNIAQAMDELSVYCNFLKIFGSFPCESFV
jgi:chorismate mutase / prephenate dehydratase